MQASNIEEHNLMNWYKRPSKVKRLFITKQSNFELKLFQIRWQNHLHLPAQKTVFTRVFGESTFIASCLNGTSVDSRYCIFA